MPTKKSAPPLSRTKRILFATVLATIPLIVLLLLEFSLRWLNYGPDLRLFHSETIRGIDYFRLNPGVKERYFGRVAFSPSSSPDYFRAEKQPGTYRIFFLGGSTTVGYPYWYNGSFSSFLRQRLRAAFPDRIIEVVNIGMTATNSYTVLDMARDVINHDPDLLIVYDGHNEFYGALGVSSAESLGGSRFLSTLSLRLVHYRTFQLLRSIIAQVRGWLSSEQPVRTQTTLMERLARGQYVPRGSDTYWRAYEAYKANMRDLADICLEHRVPVILSTQVSNLRDLPPFVSGHLPSTSETTARSIDSLLTVAQVAIARKAFEGAEATSRRALVLDSTCARSSYILGQSLVAQRRWAEAWTAFAAARDYDELRFRMSSDFNRLVLEFNEPPLIFAADIEQAFRDFSRDSVVGNDLITEHLHPYARGFFIASNVYAHIMRTNGLLASETEWRRRDTLTVEELWDLRAVTDLDERIAIRRTEVLTAGWPFKEGFPIVDAMPKDTLSQIVEQATRTYLDWKGAHEAAADYYLRRGELKNAEREFRAIIDQIPFHLPTYMSLAQLLYGQGKHRAMIPVLKASLAIEPTIQAYRTLGDFALQASHPEEALSYYERMKDFTQTPEERASNDLMLARAYFASGKNAQSREVTMRILKDFPAYQPAVELLVQINERKR